MLTYRRLKTIENSKTVSRKIDHDRLRKVVVYERFQYKAVTESTFFCVFGKVVAYGR